MNCAGCRWFEGGPIIGLCHRFPATVNKHGNDWCGEFTGRLIVAPVEPVDVEIAPKRRGRPPKVKDDQASP